MIQYILECIAFQLVFLIIYDLFLKRETFFQWNRFYLIGTYIFSIILSWIKIEAMKTTVPNSLKSYPEFLWNFNDDAIAVETEATAALISWEYVLLFGGMFLATAFFGYKLYQIYALKRKGEVRQFKDFTRIVVANSAMAFSFFKSIFLGDKVIAKEHQSIIDHELVHIRQRHSYDLLFFEVMRIIGWFNPLVYIYQRRVSELHEYVADAKVAKTDKKGQYEFLLSQVFQTQNISFINQFFKTSLIKKRIVMLQRNQSKKIWQLKYLVLIPLVLGMLVYTSCETETETENKDDESRSLKMEVTENEKVKLSDQRMLQTGNVSFSTVDEVPVYPGCEDAKDKRKCFNDAMRKHVIKYFNYPEKALEKNIQGKVYVNFTINEAGDIQNIRMRGPDKSLEEATKTIIERLPKMKPGETKGKKVPVNYSIPITFKLKDEMPVENLLKNELNDGDALLYILDGKETTLTHVIKMFSNNEKESLSINFLKGDSGKKKYGEKGKKGVFEISTKKERSYISDLGINSKIGIDPIYFVDGMPTSLEEVQKLTKNQIEEIRVLKDKIAIEKYGARAKKGVVEITTKEKD